MSESLTGSRLGPYELLDELGRGGMATVYRAYQRSMDRFVALKVIHSRFAQDSSSAERFQREARLIARLEHPHVLPVYDFDGICSPQYIVMRYLAGGTLKELMLYEPEALDHEALVRLLYDVASALDYAHRQGIVHRDLKPSNIMIDDEGHAFLTDFGIARLVAEGEGLTQHGVMVGTPEYMAPEQATAASEVGPPADLYALGVLIFEVLADALPFDAPTPVATALLHVTEPPPRIVELNRELPEAVDGVLQRALAKKPEARYESATALVAALAQALNVAPHDRPHLMRRTRPSRPRPAGGAGSSGTPTLAERNKHVTVLCVNTAEFVELMEDLAGAEEARRAQQCLMEAFGGAVREHEGVVLSRTPPTLTALWGATVTHEDDAERALRAALQIRDGCVAPGLRWSAGEHQMPLKLGVHTGPVLVTPGAAEGTGGDSGFSASGATLSIATRVAEQAEGRLLIGHATFREVSGVFDLFPADPIRLRSKGGSGSPTLLPTYEVVRVKARSFRRRPRGIEGVQAAMVGRSAEHEILQRAFLTVVEDRQPQAVTVMAEAGLGKSRLLEEFETWIDLRPEHCFVFRGRGAAADRTMPFALLHDLLSFRFEILDDDAPATVCRKIELGMAQLTRQEEVDQEMVQLVGHLAGFDLGESPYVQGLAGDPDQLAARARQLFVRFMAAACGVQAVLLTVEDAHNADDASLDLLIELVAALDEAQLLVVFLARPELLHRRPAWGSGRPNHRRLTLAPLDRLDSRELVREMLQKLSDVPVRLRDLLVERAEGNPLFMEELVKMLIEDRVIQAGIEPGGAWQVVESRLAGLRVPPTLTGLLQARLDTLLNPERAVLQRAAVVGRVFSDLAVRALAAADEHAAEGEDLDVLLARLAERGFLIRHEAQSVEGGQDFSFAQNMLRDLIHDSLLRRQREAYHAALADWLAAGRRQEENLALIATHYEEAGRRGAALEYLRRAGDRARGVCAYGQARTMYEHGLHMLEDPAAALATPHSVGEDEPTELSLPAPDAELKLRLALGEVLLLLGSYGEAEEQLQLALTGARAAGDERVTAAALYQLSQWASALGEYERARELLEEGLPLARTTGDSEILSRVLYGQGDLLWRAGHYDAALEPLEASLSAARRTEAPNAMLYALNRLGSVRMFQKRYDEARALYEEGRRIATASGNRERLVAFLNNLGEIRRLEGDFLAARMLYLETLEINRETGRRGVETVLLSNLGAVALQLDQLDEAAHYARQGLALARELGLTRMLVGALILFAQLAARQGDGRRGLELLGLVTAHPAADADLREYAAPTIEELRASLPAAEVKEALDAGGALDLEAIVAELLDEA